MLLGDPSGRFCYDLVTREWDWDEDACRMHGYDPGTVRPTTEIVTECKDPDDRERLAQLLERVERTAEDFALAYELVGGDGVERRLVIVGEGHAMAPGGVSAIEGHFIDLTAELEAASSEASIAAMAASAEARATIEQAKGVLMLAYGIDDAAAFAMLRWWSRDRNVKVRDLSRLLVEQVASGRASDARLRTQVDRMLHDLTR